MPNNFRRPNLPYINISLPNDKRFQLLTRSNRRPPTDQMIDTDINYIIDQLNVLDLQMDGIVLGDIPGINDPANAGKLLSAGVGSWVFVQASNILDQSITGSKLFPQTITATQLADGGIPGSKVAQNTIDTGNLVDGCNTLAKQAPNSVGTNNLVDGCNTLAKQAPNSVDTNNLVDGCNTLAKQAPNSVGTDQIIDNSVTLGKLPLNFAASKADQITATSSTVYTNPSVQQHHPSSLKFRCSFDGSVVGTNPPTSGYNVPTVQRQSMGRWKINITVPFTTANCDVGVSCALNAINGDPIHANIVQVGSDFVIVACNTFNTVAIDSTYVSVFGWGTQ